VTVSTTSPSSQDSTLISQSEVATDALRNILIDLQGTLLRHLWVAQEDDNMTDFNILVDASDFGRIQSVTVLNELYMRMAQAAPLRPAVLPVPGRIDTLDSALILPWEQSEQASHYLSPEPVYQATIPTRSKQQLREGVSSPGNENLVVLHTPKKKWGIFPASRSHKAGTSPQAPNSRSNADEPIFGTVEDDLRHRDPQLGIQVVKQEFPAWKPPSRSPIGSSPKSHREATDMLAGPASFKPSPNMVIDEDNPWVSEVSTSSILTDVTSDESPPEMSTLQSGQGQHPTVSMETLVSESDATTRHVNVTQKDLPSVPQLQSTSGVTPLIEDVYSQQDSKRPQWNGSFMSRERTSTEAGDVTAERRHSQGLDRTPKGSPTLSKVQSSPQNPSRVVARNPYGGFCKGAYKLQVDLEKESFKLRNSSTSMTGQSQYWACSSSKCAFEGPAVCVGKSWTFDNDVQLFNNVQYRWKFLAKSHVALSKVKNRQYDYQCVFCDRSEQASSIYRSDRTFLNHISSHRGQHPTTLLSEEVCCIAGRVAREDEEFDVNLMPIDELRPIHDQTLVDSPDSPISIAAEFKTLEDSTAFQWPGNDRPTGTRHEKNTT